MKYEQFDLELNLKEGIDAAQKPRVSFYILDTAEDMTLIKKRPMVLICAGGAYAYRSKREGEPIAMKYLAAGFHAALVEYSVAPAKWPCAARELARAVALARENAEKWAIHENGIFVCGFSAGGHLAATLATMWDDPLFYEEFGVPFPERADVHKGAAKGNALWRPDGAVLGYPVITMLDKTHEGSRDNLLGANASEEFRLRTSMEKRVTENSVPAFVWHTAADGSVPVENSLQYVSALQAAKVPYEFHIFEHGGHGISLANLLTSREQAQIVPANEVWIDLSVTWIKGRVGKLSELE